MKWKKTEYKGLGMENVKRRLELIYPRRHKLLVTEKEDSFIVQLEVQHMNQYYSLC